MLPELPELTELTPSRVRTEPEATDNSWYIRDKLLPLFAT